MDGKLLGEGGSEGVADTVHACCGGSGCAAIDFRDLLWGIFLKKQADDTLVPVAEFAGLAQDALLEFFPFDLCVGNETIGGALDFGCKVALAVIHLGGVDLFIVASVPGVHGFGDSEALHLVVDGVLDTVDGDAGDPCGELRPVGVVALQGTPGLQGRVLHQVLDVLLGKETLVSGFIGEIAREADHRETRGGKKCLLLGSGKGMRRTHG